MPYLRKVVPEKFYKLPGPPRAKTVGGLIALLQELPADLPLDVEQDVDVVDIKRGNPVVAIQPADGW